MHTVLGTFARRASLLAVVVVGGAAAPVAQTAPVGATLCVGSVETGQVLRFDSATGAPSGVCAAGGGLTSARGIAIGPDANVYVSDYDGNRVLRYNGTTGAFMDTFVSSGSGGLFAPQGLTFGPDGNLYVVNFLSVRRYDGKTGAFLGIFASPIIGGPVDLTFGPDGNLYVTTISQVQRFDGTTGAFIDAFSSGGTGSAFAALAFGPDRNLYVADNLGNEVTKFDGRTGARLTAFRVCTSPLGLAFGPDGRLYVGCRFAGVLRLDPATGTVLDTFIAPGSGGLGTPFPLAFVSPPADTTPPLIAPSVTGTLGANGWYVSDVSISWNVSDPESGIVSTAGCDPASLTSDTIGSSFTCSATNGAGLSSSQQITVKRDTTKPLLLVPESVWTDATGPAGTAVSYTASATDNVDASPSLVCQPASASVFPIGTTTVGCTAVDEAGNTSNASFPVTVKGARDQLVDLITYVDVNNVGTGTSLDTKLRAILGSVSSGQTQLACETLRALLNQVAAQKGKALSVADGLYLTTVATRIAAVLVC